MLNYLAHMRITTAAALCILCLASACSRPEPATPETIAPVQTAPVQRSSIQRIIKTQGILYAFNQASVIPKISAPVREFYVNRGSHVRKGQLLAELENRDLTAAAAEAKGMVAQAEASHRNLTEAKLPEEIGKAQGEVQSSKEALAAAQKVYESRKELLAQGALPRRQVDEANVAFVQARSQYEAAMKHLEALEKVGQEADTQQSQAQLGAAKARSQGAEVQLEYSRILSPMDGVVTERPLYAGEMAGPGTVMLTIMDISRVVARANVPGEFIKFLKAGASATIASADGSSELPGKVTVISSALDPNSTTAEVWVEAANPGEQGKPGSSVQVSIVAETIADAIVIPLAAILPPEEGATTVMVAGSDSLAHRRTIETGIREGDKVQVVKGLEPGEQVIVVGALGLEDKAKVRIEKPGAKAEEKADDKTDTKTEKKPDGKTNQHD